MAKVWKREWTTSKGEKRSGWVADYFARKNGKRTRIIKGGFAAKAKAQEYLDQAKVDVKKGIHTAPSGSITVSEAAKHYLDRLRNQKGDDKLRRSSLDHYEQHIRIHIEPPLGHIKLALLTAPEIEDWKDKLTQGGDAISKHTARKVLRTLKAVLADARRRGKVAQNVASDTKIGAVKVDKLEVGEHFPTVAEVQAMVKASQGDGHQLRRALVLVICHGGLRYSELAALKWSDIDAQRRVIKVRRRADRYHSEKHRKDGHNSIGKPKSVAGSRDVPTLKTVFDALNELRIKRGRPADGLVFGTATGKVEHHSNLQKRHWQPAQVAAGVLRPKLDKTGEPELDKKGKQVKVARYSGLHAGRHFFASWCANTEKDGGLGLNLMQTKKRMGQSSLKAVEIYAHLFDDVDPDSPLSAADSKLYG